jgi:tetratricopeptide (TPR) repeat protein
MIRGRETTQKGSAMSAIGVPVVPANYLVVILLASFLAAFLLYLELDGWSLTLLGTACFSIPLLAYFDRVSFDGRRIRRTGLLPKIWARLTGTRDRIKISDVELVQTSVIRTIKRGSNLFYTYRTAFVGKGKVFAVNSTRKSYARFIEAVLPKLKEDIMDRRSVELRDHFSERAAVRERARAAKIPSAEILEDALGGRNARTAAYTAAVAEDDGSGVAYLHSLANELRVSGLLPQAVEAFRRAARLAPGNAALLLDFALCLRTYAAARADARVERRALAMMRLAERRAGDDGDLLSRIGESYFQFGEWRRAAAVFRRAADRTGEHFRTLIGLAEVSLHEGKIAHVIHNFTAASSVARTPALRRWTRQEVEYFSRLNDDEEYMDLEIGRLNLLDKLESVKRSSLRITMVGIPAIVLGIISSDTLIANLGWAVSLIALGVWGAMILGLNMLSARIPYHLIDR